MITLKSYWRNINIASKTLKTGLKLTLAHLRDATEQRDPLGPSEENYFEKQHAIFTVQYPKEVLPVPAIGRYKLHNEIDDCIVCDKCAKICPVDCIDIEPVRATEEIGKTSDGTSKRIYAAKFDIDMAKCCFCGLCTTVCPTECLTMTDEYDFSTYDIKEHNFAFANMTPLEILAKKQELEAFNKKKEEAKAATSSAEKSPLDKPKVAGAKPVFKPKMGGAKPKIAMKPKVNTDEAKPIVVAKQESGEVSKPKPRVKPKMPSASAKPKPVIKPKTSATSAKSKPVIKPKITPQSGVAEETSSVSPKPKVKPKIPMKPKVPPRKEGESE